MLKRSVKKSLFVDHQAIGDVVKGAEHQQLAHILVGQANHFLAHAVLHHATGMLDLQHVAVGQAVAATAQLGLISKGLGTRLR